MGIRTTGSFLTLVAAAGTAARIGAQSPITADSLASILTEARSISMQVRNLYWSDADIQSRAATLVADFAKHNNEPCEYPQGQPELCTSFELERGRLVARSADLQKEMKTIETARHKLQDQFAGLMARLRSGTYVPSLAAKKDRLVACTILDPASAAVACLDKVVPITRRPPG